MLKIDKYKDILNIWNLIKYSLILLSILLLLIIVALVLINYLRTKEFFRNSKYFAEYNEEYVEPEIIQDLLTNDQIEYIIEKSNSRFENSTVVAGKGVALNKNARDSETAWLSKNDPMVRVIMEKVCRITNKSIDNCEDLQVVRYKTGGYYKEHHDACCDETELCDNFRKEGGGQRVRTCVIYLTQDFEGGETNFPVLNMKARPFKGSGVLFHPMTKDETKCHPKALHAGMPVINGLKMIANVWIREGKFESRAPL